MVGCAEAASTDWVGPRPEGLAELEFADGAPEEAVGEIYEAPSEPAPEPEPEPTTEPEPEPEPSTESEPEPEPEPEPTEEVVDDGENHDVLNGTLEDGYYYMTATIGSGYTVTVDVTSTEKGIINDDGATDDISESKGDLEKARLKFLKKYNDGDEDAAEEALEDEYSEADDAEEKQISEIMKYKEDLGKLFHQLDITAYNFSTPYTNDGDYLEYDVYSSKGDQFMLDITFEDDAITDITMEIEEI